MTNKCRMQNIIKGLPVDRQPFVAYDDNVANYKELWTLLGEEHVGIFHGMFVHTEDQPGCRMESRNITLPNGKPG